MAKKAAESDAETITKTEAVKRAIAEGVENPTEGVAYVKEKFGLDITPPQYSTYKSILKKKAGATPARRGPKSASPDGQRVGSSKPSDAASLARDVKRLVEAYGAGAVTEMTKVFAD